MRLVVLTVIILITILIFNISRYWGEWGDFFSLMAGHVLFGQVVVCYLLRKTVALGPVVLRATESPGARKAIAVFSFFCFMVLLFY